jgi:hypothetical protein
MPAMPTSSTSAEPKPSEPEPSVAEPDAEGEPEPAVTIPVGEPEPNTTPDPSVEPVVMPEPATTPEPAATPEPSETPEPSATPEPAETPEPSATPEPDPQPEAEPEVVQVEPEDVPEGPAWCGEPEENIRGRALCSDDFACAADHECLAYDELPYCVGDGGGEEEADLAPIVPPPNCEMGGECPAPAECDPTSPRADFMGCVSPICTIDSECQLTNATCDPEHELADVNGCRYLDCVEDDYPCPQGTRCNEDPALARCQPIPCNDPESEGCAAPFVCGESGQCERVACTTSADCDCGSCVKGLCHEQPGYCEPLGCP